LLVEDVREKSRKADAVVNSLTEVGKSLEQVSSSINRTVSANQERLGNVVALVGAGIDLVKRWRSDRKS
jgi:uncharacterized protein YoxC